MFITVHKQNSKKTYKVKKSIKNTILYISMDDAYISEDILYCMNTLLSKSELQELESIRNTVKTYVMYCSEEYDDIREIIIRKLKN